MRGRRAGRFLLARACFSGLCVGLSIGPTGVMAPGSSRPEEDRTPPRGGSSHPLHCNFRLYRNQIPAYGPSVLPGVAGPAVVLLQDVFGSSGAGVKAARFLRAEGCLDAGSRTARYCTVQDDGSPHRAAHRRARGTREPRICALQFGAINLRRLGPGGPAEMAPSIGATNIAVLPVSAALVAAFHRSAHTALAAAPQWHGPQLSEPVAGDVRHDPADHPVSACSYASGLASSARRPNRRRTAVWRNWSNSVYMQPAVVPDPRSVFRHP